MENIVQMLANYGYLLGYTEVGEVDGEAGPKFDTAVKHFQRDNDCVVDGEITEKQIQKLTYYAHAWYLTKYKKRLFNESPQAWIQ